MIRLGRVDVPGWFEFLERSDGEMRISGGVDASSYEHLMAIVAAIEGLADNVDEPVVPVVIPTAGLSEMGRVLSASCDLSLYEEGQYRAMWSVMLAPVANARRPVVTSAVQGLLRKNDHSLTVANYLHAVPAAAVTHSWLPAETGVDEVRPTDDGFAAGGVRYRRVQAGSGQTVAVWSCAPEDWYQGACYVEQLVDGEWVPVVGRVGLEQPWRAGNGLVTVSLVAVGASAGRLRVEWHRPVSLAGPYVREFGLKASADDATDWSSVEVLALSPTQVKVRAQVAEVGDRCTTTITLRRGDRNVSVSRDFDGLGGALRVRPMPAEAMTTYGTYAMSVTATSAGANWYMGSNVDVSRVPATGTMWPNPEVRPWSFMLGAKFGLASGDSAGLDASLKNWLAVQSTIDGFSP